MTGLSAFATAAAVAVSGATVRGYEIRQVLVTRGPDGEVRRTEKLTVHLAGDRARLERGEKSGEIKIVRLREGEVLEIDDLLRSYERKSFKKLREQWRTLNALLLEQIEGTPLGHPRRAELVDQLTDGPDKWREIWKLPEGGSRAALVEKYGLHERPPKVEVRRTKEKKEIAGAECVLWEALEDGEVADRAYLAVKIELDPRYYEFMELVGWIGPELAAGLRRVKLLPLETVMRLRDGSTVEIKTESVTEKDLDASLFEVPEGYKERKAKAGLH